MVHILTAQPFELMPPCQYLLPPCYVKVLAKLALCGRKSRLGYWRKIKGYTQHDLGVLLRVNPKTISNWELDITNPTKDQAEILAKLLGVSARELFPFTAF